MTRVVSAFLLAKSSFLRYILFQSCFYYTSQLNGATQGHGHILYFSDRQEINMTQEITTYTPENLHPMIPKRMKQMYKSIYFYQAKFKQRLKSMFIGIND